MNCSKSEVKRALAENTWDFGNEILYKLCRKNPEHTNKEIIAAKVWLIGRSYAAAIERRRSAEENTDLLYEKKVIPVFMKSELDEQLSVLKQERRINLKNVGMILKTHRYLVDLLYEITGMNKRSLASKYLHFHLPKAFLIYDNRALSALHELQPRPQRKTPLPVDIDSLYANFTLRALNLMDEIKSKYNIKLTPRQLDKLLLSFHRL